MSNYRGRADFIMLRETTSVATFKCVSTKGRMRAAMFSAPNIGATKTVEVVSVP